jgi:hypothetical protein
MVLGLLIVLVVLFIIFFAAADISYKHGEAYAIVCAVCLILGLATFVFGFFHGFIYHPATEGTHQGVITAVDLEGVYFRRYEVYLKSSGYTNQSDETTYLLYDYESDLANQMKEAIGKEVKINYGFDGGYIGWKSCGTYHIKSIEILDE